MNNLPKEQKMGLSEILNAEKYQNWIKNAFSGDEKAAKRVVSSIIAATSVNPALQECTPRSLVSCALLAESLGLSISPQLGECYPVPFKDTKTQTTNAVFVLGYRGMYSLMLNSDKYADIVVAVIKKGELASYDLIRQKAVFTPITDPVKREVAEVDGYYAEYVLLNGFKRSIYWPKATMEAHALRYSKAYKSDKKNGTSYSFWTTSFEGMALKTMLRQLFKLAPKSLEMRTAVESDERVIDYNLNPMPEIPQIESFAPTPEEIAEIEAKERAEYYEEFKDRMAGPPPIFDKNDEIEDEEL